MTTPLAGAAAPWTPPESPAPDAAPAAGPDQVAGPEGVWRGGAGRARARGDARVPRVEGNADLDGNPLREPGVGGPGVVLDEAVALLRFRFRRFVALAATVVVPVQLLALSTSLRAGLSGDPAVDDVLPAATLFTAFGASGAEHLLLLALHAVALGLVGMAAGHLVASWLEGRDPTYGQVVAAVGRRVWVAPVVVVAGLVVKVPFVLLGGFGFVLGDALVFTAAAVAGAERLGPFGAVRRSIRLARHDYGLAVVVALGGLVLTQVLQSALVLGPLWLVSTFSPPEGWLVAVGQLGSLVVLVTMPLTACIAARTWVELRCRVEGVDLRRRGVRLGLVEPA